MAKFGTRNPSNYDPAQLARGIEVEREHRGVAEFAQKLIEYLSLEGESSFDKFSLEDIYREIAMDHLDEFPNYYIALDAMEKALKRSYGRIPKIVSFNQQGDLVRIVMQFEHGGENVVVYKFEEDFKALVLRIYLLEAGVDPKVLEEFEDAIHAAAIADNERNYY